MLTEQEKKAIEDCVTRPISVWEGIKSIITAEKYTWYLESLAHVHIVPNIAERKAKWDGKNAEARRAYMETDDYDEDLKKVLQQVANVLSGFNVKDDDFKVGSKIPIWKRAETIQRQTAFKAAIAFRFTIEETRQLLFTTLDDDEQMDFNPRLPNEMIYAYAIINELPMNGVQNKDNGDESPQTSVQELLYEAKLQFLEILFGGVNASYFPKLIEVADSHFNILDSVNMTKSALFLAAIKTASLEVLLKNIADEIKEDSSQTEEETTKTERCPKLLPDDSVMQYCYEYVSYSQEYVPDEREDDTSDAVKSKRSKPANLRKKKYYKDIVERPDFRKAQISQVSCLPVLNYVVSILKTAQNLVVLNRENDRDEDGNKDEAERRVAIYSDMEKYIKKCVELVQKFPEEYLISPVDFLPLLDDSNLGNYAQSEFTAMIDNIVIRKVVDDWEKHLDENINRHVSSYHGISSQLTGDQVKYFQFFFDALKIAVRDLRAITARGCQELWPAYIEMNRILKYCYFSDDGVGMKLWEYEEIVSIDRGDYTGKLEYTYTVDKLQYNLDDAENMPDPVSFISNLLNDIHCFEFFNHTMVSKGKNAFVSGLDKEGERKIIGRTRNALPDCNFLFLLREDDTFTQDDDLKSFYHYRRFQKQYYEKTMAFSRSDILKLAFWRFLVDRMKNYNSALGVEDFTTYFDDDVAPDTCCAAINESNSLDRFLLLCLEHEDPILFLRKAIAYQKTLPKKDSKNFWKMLQ